MGGLHTLNQLALAKPRGRSTEPYSLEFGLGFRELTVELRFNLSIALPEAGPDSLLYHAKSAPLAQQLKLSLSLSNLSASAIAFAPLSTDELFATPWLYLTPACLLRPLRVASLRQLLLSLSPDVIRLGERGERPLRPRAREGPTPARPPPQERTRSTRSTGRRSRRACTASSRTRSTFSTQTTSRPTPSQPSRVVRCSTW